MSNFAEIRPMGAAMMYADRPPKTTKLIGVFRKDAKANNKVRNVRYKQNKQTNKFIAVVRFWIYRR